MLDFALWQSVSRQPITERDLSIMINQSINMEIIADNVYLALKEKIHLVMVIFSTANLSKLEQTC